MRLEDLLNSVDITYLNAWLVDRPIVSVSPSLEPYNSLFRHKLYVSQLGVLLEESGVKLEHLTSLNLSILKQLSPSLLLIDYAAIPQRFHPQREGETRDKERRDSNTTINNFKTTILRPLLEENPELPIIIFNYGMHGAYERQVLELLRRTEGVIFTDHNPDKTDKTYSNLLRKLVEEAKKRFVDEISPQTFALAVLNDGLQDMERYLEQPETIAFARRARANIARSIAVSTPSHFYELIRVPRSTQDHYIAVSRYVISLFPDNGTPSRAAFIHEISQQLMNSGIINVAPALFTGRYHTKGESGGYTVTRRILGSRLFELLPEMSIALSHDLPHAKKARNIRDLSLYLGSEYGAWAARTLEHSTREKTPLSLRSRFNIYPKLLEYLSPNALHEHERVTIEACFPLFESLENALRVRYVDIGPANLMLKHEKAGATLSDIVSAVERYSSLELAVRSLLIKIDHDKMYRETLLGEDLAHYSRALTGQTAAQEERLRWYYALAWEKYSPNQASDQVQSIDRLLITLREECSHPKEHMLSLEQLRIQARPYISDPVYEQLFGPTYLLIKVLRETRAIEFHKNEHEKGKTTQAYCDQQTVLNLREANTALGELLEHYARKIKLQDPSWNAPIYSGPQDILSNICPSDLQKTETGGIDHLHYNQALYLRASIQQKLQIKSLMS